MVIDATAIILLFLFVFFGYKSGFMKQFVGLGAVILTIIFAPIFSVPAQPLVAEQFQLTNSNSITAISLLITILAVFLTSWIVIRLATHFFQNSHLIIKITDRVLGTIFGFVKGTILVIVLSELFLFAANSIKKDEMISIVEESLVLKTIDNIEWNEIISLVTK